MRKRSKFLIATLSLLVLYILLALAMPVASGPLVWIIGDKLDWESRRLTGWNARNCGRVSYDAEGGNASRCVMEAFRDKEPFRVRFETISVDEASAFAIVGARDGHLYHLGFLGGSSDGGVNFFHQDVTTWRCQEPISFHQETGMEVKDRGLISCR
jgi:hypothetical protein